MYPFLLSEIFRGTWLIRPEDAIAGQTVVYKLLHGEYSDAQPILSTTLPIPQATAGTNAGTYDQAPEGSTAIIPLKGSLLKNGTLCSYGTAEIANQIRTAIHSPKISSIVLDIDSGGGACNAVAPVVEAIREARAAGVPVVASCDLAASAAYWIASECDRIVANNDISAAVGSIGVMCSLTDVKPFYEKLGVAFHDIYAEQSPDKNEAFTLALKGDYTKIKSESLNPLAVRFQDAVKTNRPGLKSDIPGVLTGRMFYAQEALAIGLIDEIGTQERAVQLAGQLSAEYTINNYVKITNLKLI